MLDNSRIAERKPRYSRRRWAIESEKHRAIIKLLRHGVGICTIAEIVGVASEQSNVVKLF